MKTFRRIASARNPQTRFYLALGFLLWSLVPHFQFIYHSHAGGSHFHVTLAPSQVNQANQLIDALGPASLSETAMPEVGGEGLTALSSTAMAGAAMAAADVASELHSHYSEDANLAGLSSWPVFSLLLAALLVLAMVRYQAPLFRFVGKRSARGPPVLLPA